jgi:hypothetical protein
LSGGVDIVLNESFRLGGLTLIAFAALSLLLSLFEDGEGAGDKSVNFIFTLAAFNLGSASRVLADKLAFWLGALGFVAFPIAVGFLANSFANGFGDLAVGNAVGLLAESHALGAVLSFAGFIRAPDFAVRLFAFNIANGIFRLLA